MHLKQAHVLEKTYSFIRKRKRWTISNMYKYIYISKIEKETMCVQTHRRKVSRLINSHWHFQEKYIEVASNVSQKFKLRHHYDSVYIEKFITGYYEEFRFQKSWNRFIFEVDRFQPKLAWDDVKIENHGSFLLFIYIIKSFSNEAFTTNYNKKAKGLAW